MILAFLNQGVRHSNIVSCFLCSGWYFTTVLLTTGELGAVID